MEPAELDPKLLKAQAYHFFREDWSGVGTFSVW